MTQLQLITNTKISQYTFNNFQYSDGDNCRNLNPDLDIIN